LLVMRAAHPIVQLSTFRDRSFAIECVLSFCLGVGLFGSVYQYRFFLRSSGDTVH
jgi:DHA2 family multidrug resistance protein